MIGVETVEAGLRDLSLQGTGKSGGGRFRRVTMEGISTINGNLVCEQFKLDGVGRVNGGIQANFFEVHGVFRSQSGIKAHKVEAEGKLSVHGMFRSETFAINGLLKLTGDCVGERFAMYGGFSMEGMLNADTVELDMQTRCAAKEIGGSIIRVRAAHGGWKRLIGWVVPALRTELVAETIEGDELTLEHVRAQVVRGRDVAIGAGCRIDRVEYTNTLTVHETAIVKERKQA
ncbi:conserved hypothetical protein [Paenibacillus curdlanolyticus YK9]|uniref:Cytoplasmic protein n=2 Tax=Paenibacillus curdlanolyticus TaxID=59840 RepID=E0IB83_9BACL|nr:conserved hypothetical protein [Paenibacillus curdlanolyticus YK9]